MIPCTDALKAYYTAGGDPPSAALLKRTDNTVLGLSESPHSFFFNLEQWMTDFGLAVVPAIQGTGNVLYGPISAYFKTDVASNSSLAVDNLELTGPAVAPSITEDDLRAGLWDYCGVTVFEVNVNDLTMGALIRRCGNVGQVSMASPEVKIELLGASKAYQRTIGRLITPQCAWTLGDSRCTVNLATFTVTGSLTNVLGDGLILCDSARTEPGPTAGIVITGISLGSTTTVTTATPLGLPDGAAITLAGILGPALLNGIAVLRNPVGSAFDVSVDSSDSSIYPAYTGGGTATPLGGGAGYFDNGTITMLAGLNAGLTRDVRTYVEGQWTLWLPFPYQLGPDDYSMTAGCMKNYVLDCKAKFGNGINFGGFPYVPGLDQISRAPSS